MEIQTNLPGSKPQVPAQDIFDDFEFRPLSEGLGFHHGNKKAEVIKEAQRVVLERSAINRTTTSSSISNHPFEQHLSANTVNEATKEFVQNDLALFYSNNDQPVFETISEEFKVQLASKSIRLSAFVIDLLVIWAMTALTLQSVMILTALDLWESIFGFDPLMMTTLSILFASYFLLYFTLLEKFQGKSLGKDLLGLSLETGNRPFMIVIFIRSFATLAGFLSLGLTNFVDLPGKITDTKVVRH